MSFNSPSPPPPILCPPLLFRPNSQFPQLPLFPCPAYLPFTVPFPSPLSPPLPLPLLLLYDFCLFLRRVESVEIFGFACIRDVYYYTLYIYIYIYFSCCLLRLLAGWWIRCVYFLFFKRKKAPPPLNPPSLPSQILLTLVPLWVDLREDVIRGDLWSL